MDTDQLIKELKFKAIRSSGAGGQHVNKVASKIVLFFDVASSIVLSEDDRELLLKNLRSKLSKENILILNCGESRSQHKNKAIIIQRFLQLITNGLKVAKERKASKPSKASVKKRLETKKKHASIKANRKKPNADD